MSVVVVGGHTRNIGKTSVVCEIIRAFPERRWTAVKITQYGHGVCSANGEACDCVTADHSMALSQEREGTSGTDSSRYLVAGAERSFWLRTAQGNLAEAMPRLRALIAGSEGDVILESNSVLRFLRPDVYVSVLDPAVEDFKPSALQYLDRADAVVLPAGTGLDGWPGVSPGLLQRLRQFPSPGGGTYCCTDALELIRNLMCAA